MISLEQVQLLESRVSKAIEYVKRVTSENEELVLQKEELNKKLDVYQKRIDELEVLIMRFKEDQGRIEDGIIAALDRLSQFEEAFENSLKDKTTAKKTAVKVHDKPVQPSSKEIFFEIPKPIAAAEQDSPPEDSQQLDDDLSSEGELDIF